MSDITTGAAVGALTIATLSILGVEPQSVVCAAMGAGIGTTWAPEMGRIRGVVIFTCVTGLCAIGGTAAAIHWSDGSGIYRNLFAGTLATLFHPLIAGVVTKLPDVLDGILRKFGLKQ
jgi:hypothetical protein